MFPIHKYPYVDYHELNLDYIMKLARETMGLHLEVVGEYIEMKTADGTLISRIKAPYADNAEHADTADSANVATHATSSDTADYASSAGTASSATVAGTAAEADHAALATRATTAASADAADYATNAGSASTANHASTADNATNATNATIATNAGHADNADDALRAVVATDATNAVESVAISGNNVVFTTYGGQTFTIQIPYAVKAQKDDLGNTIKSTYVANVANDTNTGDLIFYDATGAIITRLSPLVDRAVEDSYGNLIGDYVKTIVASANSDYITVTHGTGDVDTITVNYSNVAWKDTNGNVIKNTYIKRLACVEDVQDGQYKLVAYNGDTPEAELFRITLVCDEAYHDKNGKELTSYVGAVEADAVDDTCLNVEDGEGNVINVVKGAVTPTGSVSVALTSGTLPSCSYANETITFNPGAFPAVDTATFTGTAADVHFDNDI